MLEYQLEYRVDGGTVAVLQAWASGRSDALDTSAIATGSTLELRAKARDADDLEEATGEWASYTVSHAEIVFAKSPTRVVVH